MIQPKNKRRFPQEVNIDNKMVKTNTSEYSNNYNNLAQEINGELHRTLPEINVTPRNNLNLGAVVHKGQNRFAKDYVIPSLKTIGSFNPITAIPMAGMELYSAYNMPESDNYGDKGQAWLNAGLELLPVLGNGVKVISEIPFSKVSSRANEYKNLPKNINQIFKEKTLYTGVPNKTSTLTGNNMRKDFINGKYKGDVWISNQEGYARNFSGDYNSDTGHSGVFKVFGVKGKGKEYQLPFNENEYYSWNKMPYTESGSGYKLNSKNYSYTNDMGVGDVSGIKPRKVVLDNNYDPMKFNDYYIKNNINFLKTDDIVKKTFDNGYDKIKMNNIMDGGYEDNFGNFSDAIDEAVLKAGTPQWRFKYDTSKLKMMLEMIKNPGGMKYE